MENQTNINGIVFLRSYFESVQELEGNDKLEMYEAIFNLVFNGIEPKFSKKYLNAIFISIQPTLLSSITRYKNSVENGKKGGRKPSNKTTEQPSTQKQKVETNQQPSITENKKPIIEEQTKNDDVDNIQGIEIDEESEQDIKEPYEFYSMDDDTIPFDFLIDYYNTLKFSNQVKRVNVYGMIENGEITNKQQLLEHSTL